MASDDLVAELESRAVHLGANVQLWPGLTIYRVTEAAPSRRDEIRGLALGIVVAGNRVQFRTEVLDASLDQPNLRFVLHLEHTVVRSMWAQMLDCHGDMRPVASTLDDELTSALLRFLRSLSSADDRRVLTSLYLQEVVYRILQRDRSARTKLFATTSSARSSVAEAITYIQDHLAEPLTVPALARQVNLSASAFSRVFREVTGSSPYQYAKQVRLSRARDLLADGRLSVSDVAQRIGYSSTSHFIKEFRARYGTTPGSYANGIGPLSP